MTDRLTPGLIRDFAELYRAHLNSDEFVHTDFDIYLEHEAARREAEQPCDRPGECEVGKCLKPSLCQAAAFEDKPAPAADDLAERLRENSDLDAAEGANPEVVALEREAASRIEAQAQKLEVMEMELVEATNSRLSAEARVRELEDHIETCRHSLAAVAVAVGRSKTHGFDCDWLELGEEAGDIIAALRAENAELTARFDDHWNVSQRAIKLWQDKNPGKENIWPDKARLMCWLMETLEFSQARTGYLSTTLADRNATLKAAERELAACLSRFAAPEAPR
tara:strand:- start:1521 stop:2360 length:840 start_codon:yes stop_codon:yes gene_type:complete